MAEAFSLLLPALEEINASPYKLEILFDFLAGSCAEFTASEHELRYLRAVYNKNVTEAQDARIMQKRFLNLAANRQVKGYYNLARVFSAQSGESCPEFVSDADEFYWLVGLMNGLQAVLNDLVSEAKASVPLDISHKVGRDANCLSNEKWWGLPDAIQATLWINSLGEPPQGVDPFAVLNQAVQIGTRQGVNVAQVILARLYIGLGDSEHVKAIIRNQVLMAAEMPSNSRYAFLDTVATAKLLAMSDYMWTEATGKRTPVGGLGTFWDDPKEKIDIISITDVL
ncbi:MAG: hypothetical protein ACU83N_02750 [Gammaproteobacteria bacterium]